MFTNRCKFRWKIRISKLLIFLSMKQNFAPTDSHRPQNSFYLIFENSKHKTKRRSQRCQKVKAWSGFCFKGIVGPYFIKKICDLNVYLHNLVSFVSISKYLIAGTTNYGVLLTGLLTCASQSLVQTMFRSSVYWNVDRQIWSH